MLLVERVRILNRKGPTLNCKVSVASSSLWPGNHGVPQTGDGGKASRYCARPILRRSGFIARLPRSASTGSKQKREYSVLAPLPPLLFFSPPLFSPPSPPLGLAAPSVAPPSVVFAPPLP